ncbi:hypothetical protein BvCmsHHP019_00080 [Escherichia coli]|nr:hypothetical protein BvCmsHHP019_00080 [Escherichia coli]
MHLIQLFFTLTTLHHVAQSKARHHLGERHRLIQFTAFQHLRHPAKQLVDVLHAHFGGFRAGRCFVQPGFIIHAMDQITHRGNRLPLRQTLDFCQPVSEAGQCFITTSAKRLTQAHIKAGGKHAFIARHRPLTQLFQRSRANLSLRRVNDTQKCAVIVRVSQHAQISQQVLDFRTREKRRTTRYFVRDAVLHQEFFKHPRLMVTAIKNGVIFVLRFIDEVMGDQLASNALSLMFFVIRA